MLIRWVDRLRMSGRLVANLVVDDSDSFVCDFCCLLWLLIGTFG